MGHLKFVAFFFPIPFDFCSHLHTKIKNVMKMVAGILENNTQMTIKQEFANKILPSRIFRDMLISIHKKSTFNEKSA